MPRSASFRAMARDTPEHDHTDSPDDSSLPNLITLVGRNIPSNFELSVAGDLELVGADPLQEAIVISDGVAEGAIDDGVYRFRFSGEQVNVHTVDWNGVPAPNSPHTPEVHVDFNVPAA